MSSLLAVLWKNSNQRIASAAIVLVALISWAAPTVFAEGLGLSTSLRSGYWNRDRSYSNTRNYGVGSAWMTLRPDEVHGLRLFADGFVQASDATREPDSQGDLREFYIEKSVGAFDFKVGRTITVWGRADKINPTDNLTVRNYKFLATDDEDQRTGVFNTQIVYNVADFRFIAIWLPEWRSPTYPIPPLTGIELKNVNPRNSEAQVAFKIDRSSGGIDWSLSYFYGYNKSPDILFESASAKGTVLRFDYAPVQVYGADFATTTGSFGWRGEVAYTKTKDSSGRDPVRQNSNIAGVFGVEKSPVENLNVNAQVLYRHVLDYQNPDDISNANTKAIAQTLALNTNQVTRDQVGFSLRPSYKMWNDTLEAEVAWVTWTYQGDSLTRPKITYAVTDSLKAIVGAEFYRGPRTSFFGRLSEISSAFAEFRYSF